MNESGINRLVSVRMIITHRLADDFRALDVLAIGHDAEFVHGEQNSALGRFQSIAHVRQGARDNYGHRIIEKGVLDLVRDIDLRNLFVGRVGGASALDAAPGRRCLFVLVRFVWFVFVGHNLRKLQIPTSKLQRNSKTPSFESYHFLGSSFSDSAFGCFACNSAILRLIRSRSSRNLFSYGSVSFGFRHLVLPSSSITKSLPNWRARFI